MVMKTFFVLFLILGSAVNSFALDQRIALDKCNIDNVLNDLLDSSEQYHSTMAALDNDPNNLFLRITARDQKSQIKLKLLHFKKDCP